MNVTNLYKEISRLAVNFTYIDVYYRAWDKIANNATWISKCDRKQQKEILQGEVSKLLPVFTKKYGIRACCTGKKNEWVRSVTNVLFSGIEDSSFFQRPGNILNMDVRYLIPPELFNSMFYCFDILEMDVDQFGAIFSYILQNKPFIDFTEKPAEEVKAPTPEANFSYVFGDTSRENYDNMQWEIPFN